MRFRPSRRPASPCPSRGCRHSRFHLHCGAASEHGAEAFAAQAQAEVKQAEPLAPGAAAGASVGAGGPLEEDSQGSTAYVRMLISLTQQSLEQVSLALPMLVGAKQSPDSPWWPPAWLTVTNCLNFSKSACRYSLCTGLAHLIGNHHETGLDLGAREKQSGSSGALDDPPEVPSRASEQLSQRVRHLRSSPRSWRRQGKSVTSAFWGDREVDFTEARHREGSDRGGGQG